MKSEGGVEEEEVQHLQEPLNPEPESTKDSKSSREDTAARLGGRPPLKTILVLAVGPIISQLANAVFLVINTLWVAKSEGNDALAAVSTNNSFDNMGRAFGFFLSVGAASQISALFGMGKSEEAAQLCADLLRLTLVFGAVVPALVLPLVKPCARWYGASEHVTNLGFDYMLPLCACAICSILYLTVLGFLQGEGRTALYGFVNFGCLALNGLCLDPLFLFGLKTGIRGVSLATVISELLPAVVLIILYYTGKFSVKPVLSHCRKGFSERTKAALKVGVSQLISQLSIAIPSIIVRKFMGLCLKEDYDAAMAGMNCAIRLSTMAFAIQIGITMGFLPPASYAYAAKKYKRYLRLCFHSVWLCFAWGAFVCIFTSAIPRQMSKLFSTEPLYLDYAEKMVRNSNVMVMFCGVRFNCQTILQSMQMGGRATLAGLLNNFVFIILSTIVLYYTNKNDGARIMYCYAMVHALSVPATIGFLWKPLGEVIRLAKEEKDETEAELEDVEEKRDMIKSEVPFTDNETKDEQPEPVETAEA